MGFKFGIIILVSYIASTSALPPCVCARNLLPVCGSDGVTYANQCKLDCAKLTNNNLNLAREGNCDEPAAIPACFCTFDYSPVCGSDGDTYPNECALNCQKPAKQNLEVKHRGECERVKVVDGDSVKVVGDSVKVANGDSTSTIRPPCLCTRELKPVCGTDDVTYSNTCLLNCASNRSARKIEVKAKGACLAAQ